MLPVHEYQIYDKVRGYIKRYPSFTRLYEFAIPVDVRQAGYEERSPKVKGTRSRVAQNPMTLIDSIRRSKTEIADITLSNDFDLFCTFTFKSDRQDIGKCKKKMSKWLKNQREMYGKFFYVIVPEFHKDGKSIHFHALFREYRGKLHLTNIKQKGRTVYNIKSYRGGFSTAVKIDDIAKVASYIRKYIVKDMPQFTGKKRYWCSNGLIRPIIDSNPEMEKNLLKKFQELYVRNNLTVKELDETLTSTITKRGIQWTTQR